MHSKCSMVAERMNVRHRFSWIIVQPDSSFSPDTWNISQDMRKARGQENPDWKWYSGQAGRARMAWGRWWQAAAHTATRGRGRRCMEERGGKQKYWHLWILIVVKKIDGVSSVSIKECKCEEVKQEDSIYSQFQAKCWLLQSQKTASVAVWRGWSKEYKPKI